MSQGRTQARFRADNPEQAGSLPGEARPYRVVARPGESGWRLDRLLAVASPWESRSAWGRAIREGRVQVEGRHPAASLRLAPGEVVLVSPAPSPRVEPAELRVLALTGRTLALDKPAGVPCHPTGPHRDGTLVQALAARFGGGDATTPRLVHRLDAATSGVVLAALDPEAAADLALQFARRRVEKTYLARVRGRIHAPLELDSPLGRASPAARRTEVRADGRPALTRVIPLDPAAPDGEQTLVACHPLTGRRHQVRAHLAAAGHPVLGDALYGGPPAERLFLHALRLAFDEPGSGERRVVEAPPGPEWGTGATRMTRGTCRCVGMCRCG
ncbi:MAG: RluA family pseudouridine synthase [Planctomycetes bacterium]|nr:RluA family pseudouridine synthase [Planctomycetota bacterium]